MKLDHSKYVNIHTLHKDDYIIQRVYDKKTNEIIYNDLAELRDVYIDEDIYEIKSEFDSSKYGRAVIEYNKITNDKYDLFYDDLIKAYGVVNNNKSKLLFNKAINRIGAMSKTKEIELFFSEFVDLIK